MPPDFNFPEFPPYPNSALPGNYPDGVSLHPIQPSAPVYSAPGQQQQQQPQQHAPFSQHHQTPSEEADGDSITIPGGQFGYDDVSRVAAEEDKRKRNTAASARFRVKKKQREAALERSAKDMTDKVTILEGRIQQLETENKWLKNMILEKNSAGGDDKKGVSSKEGSELKAGAPKP
ncbi:bZIP transcription factor [Candidatus Bathyarchaeota archaeon]|nr:bZIP transcription factor [Candidatus Bathyarchaeota archaeon]